MRISGGKHARRKVQIQRKGGITVNWSRNSHNVNIVGVERGKNKSE